MPHKMRRIVGFPPLTKINLPRGITVTISSISLNCTQLLSKEKNFNQKIAEQTQSSANFSKADNKNRLQKSNLQSH